RSAECAQGLLNPPGCMVGCPREIGCHAGAEATTRRALTSLLFILVVVAVVVTAFRIGGTPASGTTGAQASPTPWALAPSTAQNSPGPPTPVPSSFLIISPTPPPPIPVTGYPGPSVPVPVAAYPGRSTPVPGHIISDYPTGPSPASQPM